MRARRSAQPLSLPEPSWGRAEPGVPADAPRGRAAQAVVREVRIVGGRRGCAAPRRDGDLSVAAGAGSACEARGRPDREDGFGRVERSASPAARRRPLAAAAFVLLVAMSRA